MGNAAGLTNADAEIPAIEWLRHLPLLDAYLVRWRVQAVAEIL